MVVFSLVGHALYRPTLDIIASLRTRTFQNSACKCKVISPIIRLQSIHSWFAMRRADPSRGGLKHWPQAVDWEGECSERGSGEERRTVEQLPGKEDSSLRSS